MQMLTLINHTLSKEFEKSQPPPFSVMRFLEKLSIFTNIFLIKDLSLVPAPSSPPSFPSYPTPPSHPSLLSSFSPPSPPFPYLLLL